ncbi:DUF1569 domain-containing protein [uncultured Hymenobacter sp.]|uniref:DUF1569 domain-containing protein n=1 Tax=uncultured Hymenobacter sp. TaxID=170016 RepID=UPI0035CC5275
MSISFLNAGAHARLTARIEQLAPDTPRRWGTMSAQQMLVHCADQLRVSRGEKPVTSVRLPGFLKPLVKWLVVTRLKEFKPGMRTLKELDAKAGMTPLTTFADDRKALLALIEPAQYSPAGVKHPVFGHLSAQELGEVTWKHLDYHLRQFGA